MNGFSTIIDMEEWSSQEASSFTDNYNYTQELSVIQCNQVCLKIFFFTSTIYFAVSDRQSVYSLSPRKLFSGYQRLIA